MSKTKTITAITKTKGDLTDPTFCRMYWNERGQSLLMDATIKHVRYLTKKESRDMMWNSQPVALLLEKDKKHFWVFPSSDDEGNDAGALYMDNGEVMPVL